MKRVTEDGAGADITLRPGDMWFRVYAGGSSAHVPLGRPHKFLPTVLELYPGQEPGVDVQYTPMGPGWVWQAEERER